MQTDSTTRTIPLSQGAVALDDADRDGLGMPYGEGGVSYVMLCEGPQRYDEPYATEAETAALAEAGWGQ